MRMNDIITVITSVKLILAGWFEIQLLVELELRMFWRNESIPINFNNNWMKPNQQWIKLRMNSENLMPATSIH